MQVIVYGEAGFKEEGLAKPEQVKKYLHYWPVTWVNVDGPMDAQLATEAGKLFGAHPLALEDAIQLRERAKVDIYGRHHFIVARMVVPGETLDTEQISIFMGEDFVLTFQEQPGGDCLQPVRDRIRRGLDDLDKHGPPYLVYAILDTIVDAYFPLLERYGERLEDLEDDILAKPMRDAVNQIHAIKRDLLLLRRSIWPMRDVLHILLHDSLAFAEEELRFYLRDCYDHTLRVIDMIEMDRELCSDLMSFYLSSLGNRTNEVMKVLAIISTIFMPLTFVAGIYGMNFNTEKSPWNMPELNWYYGYPFALGLMAIFVVIMLMYFRWRKWL
jgi:magnesium transporter